MAVVAEKLSYTYMPDSPFEVTAIRDIDLTIQDGEFVALIGHTGSGKSTLIQHMNGLLRPSYGKITVQGIPIVKGSDLRVLRQKVGLVFQYPEYQLFEETVFRDVAFGPQNLGLSDAEVKARVELALRQVQLDEKAVGHRSPFELSGGQRRRVAIAGVLAMQPEILILDEPTAGLDPAGRDEMLSLLTRIHADTGNTILMVSHNMDEIARVAGRVLVMHEGRIVMDDAPRAVFMRGNELTAMNLGVPAMVSLAGRLASRGLDVPRGIITPGEMLEWLLLHMREVKDA